jgi:hypothetical protein
MKSLSPPGPGFAPPSKRLASGRFRPASTTAADHWMCGFRNWGVDRRGIHSLRGPPGPDADTGAPDGARSAAPRGGSACTIISTVFRRGTCAPPRSRSLILRMLDRAPAANSSCVSSAARRCRLNSCPKLAPASLARVDLISHARHASLVNSAPLRTLAAGTEALRGGGARSPSVVSRGYANTQANQLVASQARKTAKR